ncbi:MAG: fatty acid desaturase [Kofleriaceae bacterium]
MAHLGSAPLYPQARYVNELRSSLRPEVFEPSRGPLLMVVVHVAVIVVAILALANSWVPWFVVPALTVAIGISFSCLTFIGHEGMHGAILRSRRGKYLLGLVGFLPFMLSPRLWAGWHGRVHHANANRPDDPDMYPTLAEYRASPRIRFFVDAFSLGGRRWRGVLSLVLGFTVQSAHQLFVANKRGFLSKQQHRLAIAESVAAVALWATVAALIGFVPFVFGFVLPLVIANMIVMAFILTNHSLSPLVPVNDPLITGLSVTAPRWIEWLTLNFGFHVEHHVFPAMSSRHAREVRELVRERWPERYQSMTIGQALGELHRTARVYKDATTLIDPKTMVEYPVLLPRAPAH